jgi:dTDP-4-amino-4,6-dideoxygalactose transaminase
MRVPLLDLASEYRSLRGEIDAAVARVVDATAFIGGTEVRRFEEEFAAYLGAQHVIGVANGTDAIELALQALGIGPGDAVLTVPFTFAAPLEAIVRAGATPVLVDIGPDCTLDVDAAAAIMARRPVKAIIVVHLYGQPADLHRLMPLARAHGAAVIEDAAQAHGAICTVAGARRRVGSVGDVACFSFYPTKNLGAMGDAGALATNRADLAERARLYANHGEPRKYEHAVPNGRNSRLDALHATVLRIKLRHLDGWNAARRGVAARYRAGLDTLGLGLPIERDGAECVYHQYVVRSPQRSRLQEALSERGVGTAIHYPRALHEQDGFRHLGYASGSLPMAERAAAEVLSLPMSPFFSDPQVAHVIDAVRESQLTR